MTLQIKEEPDFSFIIFRPDTRRQFNVYVDILTVIALFWYYLDTFLTFMLMCKGWRWNFFFLSYSHVWTVWLTIAPLTDPTTGRKLLTQSILGIPPAFFYCQYARVNWVRSFSSLCSSQGFGQTSVFGFTFLLHFLGSPLTPPDDEIWACNV